MYLKHVSPKTCTFVASIFSWSARGYVFSRAKKAHVCFGFSEEKHEWDLAEVVNNWCLSTSAGTSMQRLEGRLAELGGGACSSPRWTRPSNLFTYFLLIKIIFDPGPYFWEEKGSINTVIQINVKSLRKREPSVRIQRPLSGGFFL